MAKWDGMVKRKLVDKLELAAGDGDLSKYRDGSVKEIVCAHMLEYVPARQRNKLMEEIYRVLVPGGKVTVVVCYWSSPRAIQDPALEWPPFCEQSFLYFNRGWREANKLPPLKCDFDFTYGYQVDQETAARGSDTQPFWIKHYLNTASDLQVVLTKRDA